MEGSTPYEDDEELGFGGNGDAQTSVAFVSTQQTVDLNIDEIDDERTPDDMVCMGVFFQDRLIARSIVPPEALQQLEAQDVFADPVRLGLAAVEEDPGLQCRLFALLPAERFQEPAQESEPEEPWASSVPRFEDVLQSSADEGDEDEELDGEAIVPVLLGHVVRFGRDRKHPDSLAEEAADVLRAILSDDRPLTNIVDKILEDL
jgi:hypothetical protein